MGLKYIYSHYWIPTTYFDLLGYLRG